MAGTPRRADHPRFLSAHGLNGGYGVELRPNYWAKIEASGGASGLQTYNPHLGKSEGESDDSDDKNRDGG